MTLLVQDFSKAVRTLFNLVILMVLKINPIRGFSGFWNFFLISFPKHLHISKSSYILPSDCSMAIFLNLPSEKPTS
jgi:hypothetical protein